MRSSARTKRKDTKKIARRLTTPSRFSPRPNNINQQSIEDSSENIPTESTAMLPVD